MTRHSLIVAAAIAGVAIAGGVAVGANLGILDAADDSEVGSLTAAGDLVASDPQVVDVAVTTPATPVPSSTAPGAQQFTVDGAGTVTVVPTADGVRLGDVAAVAGWSWTLAQSDPATLLVTFTDGTRTLELRVAVAPDGTLSAAVEEPILAPAAPSATSGEAEHEEHESEGYEHEGRDDDD